MQVASSSSSTTDSAPGSQSNTGHGKSTPRAQTISAQANSPPGSQVHSSLTAGSTTRGRKSRAQTKWPEDRVVATGIDEEGYPTPDAATDRFVMICGLIARERVSINRRLEDLTADEKMGLFAVLKEKVEYPANLSQAQVDKAMKKAMSRITSLQRRFK